jgi:hypothetical protein
VRAGNELRTLSVLCPLSTISRVSIYVPGTYEMGDLPGGVVDDHVYREGVDLKVEIDGLCCWGLKAGGRNGRFAR